MKYTELQPVESQNNSSEPVYSPIVSQNPSKNYIEKTLQKGTPSTPEAQQPWWKTLLNSMEEVPSLSMGYGGGMNQEAGEKASKMAITSARSIPGGLADIADTPANLATLASTGLNKISGGNIQTYEQTRQQQKDKFGFTVFPEAGMFKKALYNQYPELVPKNSFEKRIDSGVSTIMGYLINPFGKSLSLGMAASLGIGGELASLGAEKVGLSGLGQGVASLASQLGLSLIANRWNLHGLEPELWDVSRAAAKGAEAEGGAFFNKLNNVEESMLANKSRPGASDIIDKINDAKNIFIESAAGPEVDFQKAIDFIQNINATLRQGKLEKFAKFHLNDLKKGVSETLANAKDIHPEAYQAFKNANDFSAAWYAKNAVTDMFAKNKKLQAFITDPTTKRLLGIAGTGAAAAGGAGAVISGLSHGAESLNMLKGVGMASIPVSAGLLVGDQLIKGAQFAIKNPIAKKALGQLNKAAIVGNAKLFGESAKTLNNEMAKNAKKQINKKPSFKYSELEPVSQ